MEVNSFLLSLDVSYWYLEMPFENRIQLNKPGAPGKPPIFKILDSGLPIDEMMRNYNFMVKSQWIVRSFDSIQRSYYTYCY